MQTTVPLANRQKQWGTIVAKAWSDDEFRQRLIDDPAGVLRGHGIEVRHDTELKVMEDTAEVRHLVLPVSPSGELSDEELTCSAGYDSFSGICACGGGGQCGCGRCGCGCDAQS